MHHALGSQAVRGRCSAGKTRCAVVFQRYVVVFQCCAVVFQQNYQIQTRYVVVLCWEDAVRAGSAGTRYAVRWYAVRGTRYVVRGTRCAGTRYVVEP